MAEQIKFLKTDGLSICLFEAMVAAAEKAGIQIDKYFGIEPSFNGRDETATICVTVNGVEVPFMEQVGAAFVRTKDCYDQQVKAAAIELLNGTRFGRLSGLLEKFEWEIEQEIEKVVRDA